MSKNQQVGAVKTGKIIIPGDRYFPESVTVAPDGAFYVGSVFGGCIMWSLAGGTQMEPFIEPRTNGETELILWCTIISNPR
jgi:hypothetical protein